MKRFRPSREDFWRLPPLADRAAPFKEWQHFVVTAPGLDLLINFSVATDAHSGELAPRLIVLAHSDAWHGFVQRFDPQALRVSADGCRVELERQCLEISDDHYHLAVSAPEHDFAAELRLRPLTVPLTIRNQAIAAGRSLHWVLHPRLQVAGWVRVAGRVFELANAHAYHDHNWGNFDWGEDLAWEWGVVLPVASSPWTLVYSLLTNATRSVRKLEHLMLWDGPAQVLLARPPQLRAAGYGRWHAPSRFQLPGALALLQRRRDDDLPERLELVASCDDDQLRVEFMPEQAAQLLIPSERDALGLVRINECIGRTRVSGRARGKPLDWEGRGVFELVRC